MLYAPEEYACDSSATLRATAYMNGALVGTSTVFADPPGTWPTATLSFNSTATFNSVVVHYDSPPPTGGDWGPIFMADNMLVTTAAASVPETLSTGLALLALVLATIGAHTTSLVMRRATMLGTPVEYDENGTFGFLDQNAGDSRQRFYRVVTR